MLLRESAYRYHIANMQKKRGIVRKHAYRIQTLGLTLYLLQQELMAVSYYGTASVYFVLSSVRASNKMILHEGGSKERCSTTIHTDSQPGGCRDILGFLLATPPGYLYIPAKLIKL